MLRTILPEHSFIDTMFEYDYFYYYKDITLLSLYNVKLLVNLPRKKSSSDPWSLEHLLKPKVSNKYIIGRFFEHVLVDMDNKCLKLEYKNKSRRIQLKEFSNIKQEKSGVKFV